MNWLRAVTRRLDPWAAIVLGGLLAMGVVILLATPGPWQRVVGTEAPVGLETPVPDDVAVFVMGGRGGTCSGVLWLHVNSERQSLTAVVVSGRVSGFSGSDGYAPLDAIADGAGTAAAAVALGDALGVEMDAWVALDRKASDLAIQAMFPSTASRAARSLYRTARAVWRGRGGDRAWTTQYSSLRIALPRVSFSELGVVAFSNYVLGFGFVRSNLTLQGATSLAEALKEVNPSRVEVRAAPVVVERCRGGEVWLADSSRVDPLRQSLAMGMSPPDTEHLVTVRKRAARVLVVAPFSARQAGRYADAVRRHLASTAGAAVEVRVVSGADGRLAYRTARELDRRPALAVLVAPAPLKDDATAAVAKVFTLLRNRGQQTVISGALPATDGEDEETAAARAKLAAVITAGRMPVSPLPAGDAPEASSGGKRRALASAARHNVQTLVRACWPGTLAPGLASTRLGFAFVQARHTAVGVAAGSDAVSVALLARLRLWGFPASRVSAEETATGTEQEQRSISYRTGSRAAAVSLAWDMGLPRRSVVKASDIARDVVVTVESAP